MRRGTTKGRNIAALGVLLCVFLAPASAFAAVEITEVMYNAPGADIGREWIEVTNTGTSTVNISGYKFFQGGVNHGIAAIEGTTTLLAGQSAVVASDADGFLADWPNYAGVLLKSSFSLLNTKDTLTLKDAKLNIVDSVAYAASMGGAGDGDSLHRVGGTLVAGAPDPGVYTQDPPAPLKPAAPFVSAKAAASSKNKSSSPTASSSIVRAGEQPATPLLATQNPLWTYAIGLGGLVALGAGAALYGFVPTSALKKRDETKAAADEFEIE